MQENIKHFFSSKEDLNQYFLDENLLNQSHLKTFLGGLESKSNRTPKEKDELYYHENVNFLLGDYLDGYLTQGENFIFETYFSEAIPGKPSDSVMSIVKFYFDNISPVSLYEKESEKALVSYMRSVDYRNNYGEEKLLETIRKEGSGYYTFLQKAQGKKIISEEEETTIKFLLKKLDESEYKRQLFTAPWEYLKEEEEPGFTYEVYFQKVLYFSYQDIKCKGLLDILILKRDTETGKIHKAHIADLKTTGTPSFLFDQAVEKFRYDVQLAFYRVGVMEQFNISEDIIECSFLVLGKVDPAEPMLRINAEAEILYRGRWGEINREDLNRSYLQARYQYGKDVLFGFEWALRSYKYYLSLPYMAPGELVSQFGTEYTLTKGGII